MFQTDNGTGALAQTWNRAEQTRVWRLALWEARAHARRLDLQGAQEDLARLLQIIAGAQEGTPPARLEPNAQAHDSRALHCIVMHPSRIGMVKGAPRTRRGSLDPQTCADTFRGQGLPQTRADYRADYSVSAVLRPILQAEQAEQAEQEEANRGGTLCQATEGGGYLVYCRRSRRARLASLAALHSAPACRNRTGRTGTGRTGGTGQGAQACNP